MRRLMPLVLLCVLPLVADPHPQVVEVFTAMAAALSDSNPAGFMKSCDPAMPGYEQLRTQIAALVRQAQVLSSIDFLGDEGDETSRAVELDWFLEIRPLGDFAPLVRRRQTIKCRLERRKGKWLVTGLEPLDFFAPPPVSPGPRRKSE
jgi:hypothetical protein